MEKIIDEYEPYNAICEQSHCFAVISDQLYFTLRLLQFLSECLGPIL